MSVLDTVSPPGDSIKNLFILVSIVCLHIFVLVEGMLFYCVWRYRHQQGAGGKTAEPPQMYGGKPIEVAWTMAPLLIVFILFLVTIRTVVEVQAEPPIDQLPEKSERITVIGHQWWWEYVYYDRKKGGDGKWIWNEAFRTANEPHVPAGRPVYFDLVSVDVVHSFWVPRLGGKVDVFPGKTNRLWYQTDRTGLFLGQCVEYCGNQHANMLIRMYVDSTDDYRKWFDNQKKPAVAAPPEGSDVTREAFEAGKKAFLAHNCVNCHRVRGTPAAGSFGPDLTHLMSRLTLATMGSIPNHRSKLRAWIRNPQGFKPQCWMPDIQLSEQDVDRIVNYLGVLR
jgi:cytochrome c oxidase subunit 2